MSAASSPNPSNLILLAVIGIGAYWFMSRRAVAQPVYVQQPNRSAQKAQTAGALLGAGIGALGKLFGSSGQSNPIAWDGITNDGPKIRDDGYVFNNPTQSAFDWWMTNGTGGD